MKRSFIKVDPEKLKLYFEKHPDAYLREAALEFDCCETAITYACRKLKITRKKDHALLRQNPQKVKEYLENIRYIPKDKIVYVDETGIDKCLSRK